MQIETKPDRFLIPSKEFEPAYLAVYPSGELKERAQKAVKSLADCRVCPRDCGVDCLENKNTISSTNEI